MSKLNIIDSILHESFKNDTGILSEQNIDKKSQSFEMKRQVVAGRNIKYLIYSYDSRRNIFPFFKTEGVSNLKKMCDYVLFVEEGVHFYAFLIEMKMGKESAKPQLDAAECFVSYIISTINRLDLGLDTDKETFHIRKIRISESISKKMKLKRGISRNEHGIFEHEHPTIFRIEQYLFV
jgi:hypothetical protein